ncbi:MAG: hypothetical protein ACRD1T_17255 [Acidimicrobiia bacterium]
MAARVLSTWLWTPTKGDIAGDIVPTIRRTLTELHQIRTADDIQKSGLEFLQAIEKYSSRRNPENCGALKPERLPIHSIPRSSPCRPQG